MKRLLLFLCLCGPCGAACSISITSPSNNAIVSGPTTLSASATNCPSAVRYNWLINSYPLPGNGTFEYNYTIPTCNAGACTGSYLMPNGFGPYNASFLWDGNWPLTVQVLDSAGTVLATSASVNMIVNDYGFGACTFTSPDLTAVQSGTITVTFHCPLSGNSGTAWANGFYNTYIDGLNVSGGMTGGFPDVPIVIDTTTLEDGKHLVWASHSGCSAPGNDNTCGGPFVGVFGTFTTCNSIACGAGSNAFRELRVNYKTVYLWLGSNTTVSLFARTIFTDNSESATNATYVSATPSVATVGGGCGSLVANCTITAVAAGESIITVTDGSSHITTTRVEVMSGSPIAPHLGYDGSVCIAYNSGNCAGGKSLILTSMYDGSAGANLDQDVPLAHALALNGFTAPEHGIWGNVAGFTLATWKSAVQDPIDGYINRALSLGPFHSVLGRCESFVNDGPSGQLMSNDPLLASKTAYFAANLSGKVAACIRGDEIAYPFIGNFTGTMGQIGQPSGPAGIVVTSGTPNLATMTWTNIGNMPSHIDFTGADNACFLADGPNGNGTGIIRSGGFPGPFTFSTSCAVGSYKPTGQGGTFNEDHLVIQTWDLCTGKNCSTYGPYDGLTHKFNSVPGSINYVSVSGGVATVTSQGFDATGPMQLDVTLASVQTCINSLNNVLTRTGIGTWTYPTSCPNRIYGPAYNADTTASYFLHCSGCTKTGTLNQIIPNNVLLTATNTIHSTTPPIPGDWPWGGGASKLNYALSAPVGDLTDVFVAFAGPEAQGYRRGYPQGHPVRMFIQQNEQHHWVSSWPGMNQSQPWIMETQGGGPWYTRGGITYTLGATTGSQLTTTTPVVAVVGSKVTMTGANCSTTPGSTTGYYTDTGGGVGWALDVASIQSSTQITVSQSPACSGSGGAVVVTPANNHYYSPPYDQQKAPTDRAIELAPLMWWIMARGGAGFRVYNYGDSTASFPNFSNYPAPAAAAYTAVYGTVPPNSPNNEENLTGLTYKVTDNPSNDERWKAVGLTMKFIYALEPQIIQPLCNTPDFGPRVYTGAKCGAAGTLVIAINDNETPMTINFPAPIWSLYNNGTAPITRFQEIKAAYVNVTNIAANATSDTFAADGGEIDIWWFPSDSTPLAQSATIGFNPASVGATKTALRYSYLCNPATFASNLDQQAARLVFTSATSFALFKAPGPICYDYLYLDNSNSPKGARSNVQVLR